MVNTNNFLDLWGILVNEIIGGPILFIAMAIIFIIIYGIKTNMSWQLIYLFISFAVFVFTAEALDAVLALYVFAVLHAGALIYFTYQRSIRRG